MATGPSSDTAWMIYGANGYTGRLCADLARRRSLRPIVAGRNRQAVEAVSTEFGLPARVFALDDPEAAARGLEGVHAVLHCAGPFSATAAPMLEACVRAGTHYLDITGEIGVFEYIHKRSQRWQEAGIAALPGVGFDVVPTDCLAALLKRDLPDATRLRLAIKWQGRISPGTAKTTVEFMPHGGRVRRDRRIVSVPVANAIIRVSFDAGPEPAAAIPWGDVSSAYYSTGIPNISTYMAMPERQARLLRLGRPFLGLARLAPIRALLRRLVEKRVRGAGDEERANGETWVWGEVTNDAGKTAVRRLHTPDAYSLTADAAVTAVTTLLSGPIPSGALTPSLAFGPHFVLGLHGVKELRSGSVSTAT